MSSFLKFDKRDNARHAGILEKLNATKGELSSAIEDFNVRMADLYAETVGPKLEAYNEAVDEANGFMDDMNNAAQEYYDGKSDRWQEGEAGTQYQEWISELEYRLDRAEADRPSELSEPDFDPITEFEDIQKSAEE